MFTSFTHSHLALSKRLGWDEMPAIVALPAIDKIVNSAIAQVAHATGDSVSFDEMATVMLTNWSPDNIFAMLVEDDDFSLSDYDRQLFISLRWEIEYEMRAGSHFIDAIQEWFK